MTSDLQTVERPNHPAAKLARNLGQWAERAPAGDHRSRMLIDVVDSVGIRVTAPDAVVRLTGRQTELLAATFANATWCTSSAEAIAHYLGDFRPMPGEQPAASLVLTDWQITDDHLDWGDKPGPLRVPIGKDRLDDLIAFVAASLDTLLFTRRAMLPLARFQEGAKVRVRDPAAAHEAVPRSPAADLEPGEVFEGIVDGSLTRADTQNARLDRAVDWAMGERKPMACAGATGVVTFVTVSVPTEQDRPVLYFYEVRLDVPDAERSIVLNLADDEVEPIG